MTAVRDGARTALQVLGPSTGGIRVHVAELSSGLRRLGWEAPVVGPEGVLGRLGTQAGTVPVPAGPSPIGLALARRALGEWRSSADVVHAHGLKAAWTCIGGRPNRPIVLTLHNVVLDGDGGVRFRAEQFAERAVLSRVDRLVVPTAAMVDGLGPAVPRDRIRVALPASPVPVPHRSRVRVRSELGIPEDAPMAVCVARLHPQKDLLGLLEAWRTVHRDVPEARLVVVGEGPLRADLERRVSDRALGGTVRLPGPSPHAVDELAAADLAVIGSRWEAVPLVLVEALQLGVPTVSTDVGLAAEVLPAACVVPVGDAEALGVAMAARLADPDAALVEAAPAVAGARGRFDPAVGVATVADVYRELV
jgi:glycosyltransferase involved in cell wall biosynthesis